MLLDRKRKGMTNLIEVIFCIILFALILALLISIIAFSNRWTVNAQKSMQTQLDTEFLIESIQSDIKSAENVNAEGTEILIESAFELITYKLRGDTLYRNSEIVVSGIESAMFVPDEGDIIEIYIRFQDGSLIDVNMHR